VPALARLKQTPAAGLEKLNGLVQQVIKELVREVREEVMMRDDVAIHEESH
jgi:hypothetical protein